MRWSWAERRDESGFQDLTAAQVLGYDYSRLTQSTLWYMKHMLPRAVRWFFSLVVLALAAGVLLLHFRYNNEALAERLTDGFNRDRRGRLEVNRVSWGPHALWALAVGGSTRVTVTGLRLRDSRGQVALHLPRVVVEVRPRELLRGGSITIPALEAARGQVAWDRYPRPDGPSPRGETHEVGLLGALEPRLRRAPKPTPAPPRPRPSPRESPARPTRARFLTVSDLAMDGLTVSVSHGPDEGVLEGVTLRGGLRHSTGGPEPAALALDLRLTAPRGRLRVRQREVPISALTVSARSGAGPTRDTIHLKGDLTAEDAPVTLVGQLRGVPALGRPAVLLTVRAKHFGPLLGRLVGRSIIEEDSHLRLALTGHGTDLTAKAHVSGLRWDMDTDADENPDLDAPLLVSSTVSYSAGQVLLETARVRAWGGSTHFTGWLTRETGHWGFDAQILSHNAPWFFRRHMQEIDLDIFGMAHGMGSVRGTRRSRAFVTLLATRRTEASPMPQAVTVLGSVTGSPNLVRMDEVVAHSELGTLLASGLVSLPQGHLDLKVRLRAWQMRRHLQARGYRPHIDGLDLEGQFHGPAPNPSFTGELRLNDVRFEPLRLPSIRSPATFTDGTLVAKDLRSPRYGRHLWASVHLTLYRTSLRHLHRPILDFTWGLGRR